ncbi:fimbrial protein [Scandinavium sp. NPDC088450]|uniref:fimbrial protein n=1 Tax=Scandinavium sp. NPDC088450 TaxID=3364514 RepID=UPI00384F63C2
MQWKKYITQLGQGLLVPVLLLAGMSSAQAVVNCKMADSTSNTVPLSGHFYVGNDMPVGSVIYRTTITKTRQAGIDCDAPFSVDAEFRVVNERSGAPFSQSGIPYSGQIYPTNVPGIGVALWNAGRTFTSSAPLTLPAYYIKDSAGPSYKFGDEFDISLIKTGNISSGVTVNGDSFPIIAQNAVAKSGYSGLPIYYLWTVNFSGSITLDTSTCITPGNPTYDLGTFRPEDFPSVGATTAWKDVSIYLTNCPVFRGFYNNLDPAQVAIDSNSPTGGTLTNNMLEMTISPSTANAGDQQTFMLSDVADKASGMGYQIAHNPKEGMAPDEGGNNLYTSGDVLTQSISLERSGNVSIPLRARYKRTGDLRPGKMNGSFTVTINYK